MLYREIIAVCSEIHRKHINTAVWAAWKLWKLNPVVHIVTTGFQRVETWREVQVKSSINSNFGLWGRRGHLQVPATTTLWRLTTNYSGRTAPVTSKRCILYIYSGTEYFKHGIYSPFSSLQNAVCFIILTYFVPVLFTFYIQGVLKLKKNNSGAKRLIMRNGSSAHTADVRTWGIAETGREG